MKKFSKIKPVLLVVAIAYVAITLVNQQVTIFRQKREVKKWEDELVKIEAENQKLKDNVKMSEDENYIERIAREKLGLIKEGETTVMNKK
ncbi:cell division protein FtsL [Clostridium collagenovorans DSM 3089]|uniref:Cell division protein FtsL n=1 Tax=Clostridium collagenovorans DSM 3089 TaxID=1121306 RepID=A0A1M5Y7J6_9CLOT|nr:septum formation initiator family protein [Clostridium collagenovorans]SHI08051.1 cell division protein FtsL [Clostridium collagenovorans DSM 3089]